MNLARRQRAGDTILMVRPGVPYRPLAHQAAVHLAPEYLRVMLGGFGSGKSVVGCAELLAHCVNTPGFVALDVSPSFPLARRSILPTYEAMIAASGLAAELNKSTFEYVFGNGSRLWIASADRPSSLKGANISMARIDEPFVTQREVFDEVLGRLRHPVGRQGLLLTGTPERGCAWGHELLYGEAGAQLEKRVIKAGTAENCHNPESYLASLRGAYDERTAQLYLEGNFDLSVADRAYYCFDRTVHVQLLAYDPGLPLIWALDFNVRPFCSALIQQHGAVDHVIFELVIADGGTSRAMAELFKARFGQHKSGVRIVGDPAGRARDTLSVHANQNDFDVLKQGLAGIPGVVVDIPSPVALAASINLFNARLRAADGTIGLLIDPQCKTLIRDLEFVKRTPDGGIDKSDPALTHASDGVRYALVQYRSGPRYAGVSARQLWAAR